MVTGVILAGGRNRRMDGRLKGLLPFFGETLAERQIRQMSRICPEVIIVTNEPKPYLALLDRKTRIITDYYADRGPLGGMHAAFSLARWPFIWVVGCDMPFVSAEAATLLKEKLEQSPEANAAFPSINGGVYPLHGVYRQSSVEDVQHILEAGQAPISMLLQKLAWQEINEGEFARHGIHPSFVQAIKTEDDYRHLLESFVNNQII